MTLANIAVYLASFFEQSAEIAGTPMGLLFVVISPSPHDWHADGTPFPFRARTHRSCLSQLPSRT